MPSLKQTQVWTGEVEAILLGRLEKHILLLIQQEGINRVLGYNLLSGTYSMSEPVNLTETRAEQELSGCEYKRTSYGTMPLSAPFGTKGILFNCWEGTCLVTLKKDKVDLKIKDIDYETLIMTSMGPAVDRGKGKCILVETNKEIECDKKIDDPTGIPVDGVLEDGIKGEVSSCMVMDRIELPELNDPKPVYLRNHQDMETEYWEIHGASLIDLSYLYGGQIVEYEGAAVPFLDLLVRGYSLSIGFATDGSNEGAVIHREFGLALPPGSVDVRKVSVGGISMYRVKINHIPLLYAEHSCWLGRFVVRILGRGFDLDHQVYLNVPAEFGYCE